MKGVQRYNLGFSGFGPLEKCDTGKLMLSEDVGVAWHESTIPLEVAKIKLQRAVGELQSRNEAQSRTIQDLRDKIAKYEDALLDNKNMYEDMYDQFVKAENEGLESYRALLKARDEGFYLRIALCAAYLGWLCARLIGTLGNDAIIIESALLVLSGIGFGAYLYSSLRGEKA